MTLAVRKSMFGAGLWLALAIVGVLALDPFGGSPARETTGSAFSFFTSDVSLGPTRAPAPEKTVRLRGPSDSGTGAADGGPAALAAAISLDIAAPIACARLACRFARSIAPARFIPGIGLARAPPRR